MEYKTLKEEILAKYFKTYTFDMFKRYATDVIHSTYKNRNDNFGFEVEIGGSMFAHTTISNALHPTITIHVPKCQFSYDDCKKWFEEEGFEYYTVNNQSGWRIRL